MTHQPDSNKPFSYRKHPALQSKINAMRYRNGGISPSSDHDNSDDPVSTPSHLPMKAKRITMTISEIDIAAPSLSTIQRGPTPLSPPTHLITKPAPVVIAKSQLPNPHDNPILPPSTLEDQLCPICIHPIHSSDSARQIATCGHIFHAACLIRWLSSYHANCPLCKVELKAFELSPV